MTIDSYIKTFPLKTRVILTKFRRLIHQLAPAATESISYGLMGYKLNGKPLVYFGGWKNHIGFYATPAGNVAFQKQLSHYKGAKGSVQFPLDQPMPYDLVRQMIKYQVKETSAQAKAKSFPAKKQAYVGYHNDGSIWAKGTMLNGMMEGKWVWFRKDGTKMRAGCFKHNKQTGQWTTYDKTGRVVKITDFTN